MNKYLSEWVSRKGSGLVRSDGKKRASERKSEIISE